MARYVVQEASMCMPWDSNIYRIYDKKLKKTVIEGDKKPPLEKLCKVYNDEYREKFKKKVDNNLK